MSSINPRVCPACRKPARNRPLPPEGFWQVQVLQRIGMYPYRCEACGAKFYRKVPVGQGLGEGRFSRPPHRPMKARDADDVARVGGAAARDSRPAAAGPPEIPRVVAPPEAVGDSLTHRDFVDLIDHIRRAEERKGLKVRGKSADEDA